MSTTETQPCLDLDDPRAVPANVGEALSRIMAELPPIGKDGKASEQQGGYSYRGIEQITQHLQPLLAKYGVVIVPSARLISIDPAPGMKETWTRTVLEVRWRIHGPNATSLEAQTIGIGQDNQDKGANKAMSQAMKYLYLELFCVADSADESDGADYSAGEARPTARRAAQGRSSATKPPAAGASATPPAQTYRTQQEAAIRTAIADLDEATTTRFRAEFKARFGEPLSKLDKEHHQDAAEWSSTWLESLAQEQQPA